MACTRRHFVSSDRSVKSWLAEVLVDNPKYVEYCALTFLVFMAMIASASAVIAHLQGSYLNGVLSAMATR